MAEIDFRHAGLPHEAARFIATFLRFEFALKEAGYLPETGNAEVVWHRVTKDLQASKFFEQVSGSGRAITILKKPPKKQISRDGYLDFKPMAPLRNIDELFVAVRRVRNNFLHGGKSGDPEGDERNRKLVAEAQWIVEQALGVLPNVRAYFEGRY
jgi:hypothetical protein